MAKTYAEGEKPDRFEDCAVAGVRVTRDEFRRNVKMGEYIDIQNGNMAVLNDVMARFCVDKNDVPLSREDAAKELRKLNLEQFDELAEELKAGMANAAVPLASGKG